MLEIGKVAQLTGLTTHTLRAWEKRYDIKPTQRTETGRRLYDHDTVERLTLLKRCSEAGYSIGNTAHLPIDELKKLLEQTNQTLPIQELHDELTLILINFTAPPPYSEQLERQYGAINLLSLSSFDELPSILEKKSVDCDYLVAAYCENLDESFLSTCSMLKAQYIPALISFHFSMASVRNKYESLGIILQKAPLQGEWVRLLTTQLSLYKRHYVSFESKETLYSGEHIFSQEALEWINQRSSKLKCECPNHLSEIITKLSAFEHYSQNCMKESPQDIKLHQEIYEGIAQSRKHIEALLEKALNHEGINLEELEQSIANGSKI